MRAETREGQTQSVSGTRLTTTVTLISQRRGAYDSHTHLKWVNIAGWHLQTQGETCGKSLVYLTYYSLVVRCCWVLSHWRVWHSGTVHLVCFEAVLPSLQDGKEETGTSPGTQAGLTSERPARPSISQCLSTPHRHEWRLYAGPVRKKGWGYTARWPSQEEVQSGTNVFVGFASKSKSRATDGKSQCVNYEIQ